jgi:hypothetical protein
MMGAFARWRSSFKKHASRFARVRMTALFLVSVGVVAFLIGSSHPGGHWSIVRVEQGEGRGAGGMGTGARVPSLPVASCLPTDITCIITAVSSSVASGLQSVFQPIADQILKNPADIVYQTPLLTNDNDAQNRAILSLNQFFVEVVDLAFVCLLIIGGYNIIVGRHLNLPFSTIMEVLPRAALVTLAVHFNLLFAGLFVDFENALTLDVIHLAGLNMLTNIIAGLLSFQNVTVLSFLLIVVLGVMAIMLLIQMVTRIALVALSLALAPLGLGCFLLPQTMRWGRLWLVTLSTSVMVQFIQVVALGLGGVFITAIAATSFLRIDKSLALAFLAIGTLGLVLKIPGMLQTWALHPMMDTSGSGGGSGPTADITYPSPSLSGGSNGGGGGWTTVTETGSGGFMEGSMLAGEDGALLLMF